MKQYERAIDNRRMLVARLSELTGLDSHYTRVPRCAYTVGAFTVERDGTLTVEDGADETIVTALTAEGMIGACILDTAEASEIDPAPESADCSSAILPLNLGTEDWGEDDWEEGSRVCQPAEDEEQDVWQADRDLFLEPISAASEQQDASAAYPTETPSIIVPEAEYAQEVEEESAASLGIRDAYEEDTPLSTENTITCPMTGHSAKSLTNLICLIYSRGHLLSKSTGGAFYADKALVDAVLDHPPFTDVEKLISFLESWEGIGTALQGITLCPNRIIFNGFPRTADEAHRQAFEKLAAAMAKMALTQKRVQARDQYEGNEKYSFRSWMIRLGLNGPENKQDRKLLMRPLSGNSSFRTNNEADKWKERHRARIKALMQTQTVESAGETASE